MGRWALVFDPGEQLQDLGVDDRAPSDSASVGSLAEAAGEDVHDEVVPLGRSPTADREDSNGTAEGAGPVAGPRRSLRERRQPVWMADYES